MTSRSFIVDDNDVPAPSATKVFHAFNNARRDLALSVAQHEGLGVGYDHLEVHWKSIEALAPGATITVTAMVTDTQPDRHQVEYVATALGREERPDLSMSMRCEVLAHAQGWTLTPGDEEEPHVLAPRAGTNRAQVRS